MAEENQEKGFVSEESFRRAVSRLYDLFVRRKDGYGLSKNDFTDEEKEKLAGLENYELPVATKESMGGVIAGDGLDIDEKGKLSVLFPDLSKYATFNDIRNENSNTDLRLVKLELAAKQNKNDDEAFKAAVAERMTTFEDRVAEVKRQASDNAQHFDDYVSNESHDLDMADILNRLSGKADIETLNEAMGKKITRSDLDGALNNLLSTLQSEQQNAANDRENIRTIKSDIVSLNNLRKLVKANVSDIDYLFKALQNCLTPDALNDYMKKVPGLGLSERSFTNEDWSRLQSLHNYTLLAANAASLGGVKIGKNINVEEDGTISVELPDVSGFAYKKDCEEAVDNLDRSIAACNLRIDAERDDIGNLESSIETVQRRVTSAENAIKDHTVSMAKLASKDELAEEISAMDRAKVSVTEFERHANKKISTDDLDDDVRSKVNSTVSMSVDVSDLKRKEKGNESDITRCVNYIKELSGRVTAISDNLLGEGDYVKPVEGKELSTNDFTNSYKEKLDNSLTVDDIGSKVPKLRTDGTLDPGCFPEEGFNVKYTDDITGLTVGRSDVLYFNRSDKKLYYYDGVNFNKVRDDSWGDDGVDIRTAMMDIFAKKEAPEENARTIEELKTRCDELEEEIRTLKRKENSGGVIIADVSNTGAKIKNKDVTLTWEDPDDVTVNGAILAIWAGTKVVRKVGVDPINVDDGTVVMDNHNRNMFSLNGFVDHTPEYETEYHYKFFPVSTAGVSRSGSTIVVTPERHAVGIIEQVGRVGYNGKPQSPEWSTYDPACITVKGETQGTEIGTYEAILSLNSDDYCWPDKSLDDKTVTWTIGKGIVNIPTVTGTSRVYNGAEQGPAISSYDSSIVSVTGDKETDAGAYTVTIFLKDATHYEWNDHTTENKKTSWTIKHKLIAVPSQKGTLVYTGKKQAPEWNDYNENELVIGGTTSSTTSGTYKATFTPESNYEWADGGTETKEVEWTLGKADGDLSLDKSAIMLSKAEATDTFVVTRVGNGKISVASSDESVATVTLSGATATVTAKSEGSAIITISVAEGTNHKAPEDKTIYVNCDF